MFSKEMIGVGDVRVRPVDVTAKMLFPQWKLAEKDRDLTILRVTVEGRKKKEKKLFNYELFDSYDKEKGVTSMARTTGYTATAIARIIARGEFSETGVIPPEMLGAKENCFFHVLSLLEERNVVIKELRS